MEDNTLENGKGISSKKLINSLVMSKLLNPEIKSHNVNVEQLHSEGNSAEEIDCKTTPEPPKEIGKNKWLYPTDNFGKMEKGIVEE